MWLKFSQRLVVNLKTRFNIIKMNTIGEVDNHVTYDENNTCTESSEPSSGIIAFYFLLLIVLETLGNTLMVSIILYEKRGVDLLKQTITNQLLSSMCLMMILFNLIVMPLNLLNIIFVPKSKLQAPTWVGPSLIRVLS